MKKAWMILMMGGLVVLGREPARAGTYPTGQAFVTLVTPFNGIAKYWGASQEYVNEIASRQWGTVLADTNLATSVKIGGISSTTGKVLTKTTTALVTKASRVSVAGVLVQAGLILGTTRVWEFLEDWATEWWEEINPETDKLRLMKPDPGSGWTIDPAYTGSMSFCETASGSNTLRVVILEGDVYNGATFGCAVPFPANGWSVPCANNWWNQRTQAQTATGGSSCGTNTRTITHWIRPKNQTIKDLMQQGKTPVPRLEFEEKVLEGLASQDAAIKALNEQMAQVALAKSAAMVNEANKSFPDNFNESGGSPQLTGEEIQEIMQRLLEGVSQGDQDEVTGGDPTPEPFGEDWEYTPEQMAAAQHRFDQALEAQRKSEFEAVIMPEVEPEAEPENPEKLSLSEAMQAKLDAMEDLTIWQQLQELKNQDFSGGVCSFDVDMGLYGIITFSLCEWEDALELLGAMMFAGMSLFWLMWIFHGRGDF